MRASLLLRSAAGHRIQKSPPCAQLPASLLGQRSARFLSGIHPKFAGAKPLTPSTPASSLQWQQVYEKLPATFGLLLWTGFGEMLPAGGRLPAKKTMTLEGIFDYVQTGIFKVVYRYSPLDVHVEIASVTLTNIRQALAKDTVIQAAMEIDSYLNGYFHVRDPFTGSEASIAFDARVPPRQEHRLVGDGRSDPSITG